MTSLLVSGGSFTGAAGKAAVQIDNYQDIAEKGISGGVFSTAPNAAYIADGFAVAAVGDTYQVNAVQESNYYNVTDRKTLADALLRVKDGGTINLAAKGSFVGDFALTQTNVTITGNGNTITGNFSIGGAGAVVQNLTITGNLTIEDSVGNGDVTLSGIKINAPSQLIVKGGGAHSIVLANSTIPGVSVEKVTTGGEEVVRIVVAAGTKVDNVTVDTNGAIQVTSGGTVSTVATGAAAGDAITVSGAVGTVTASTGTVTIAEGASVGTVNASGATVNLAGTATNVNATAGNTKITGTAATVTASAPITVENGAVGTANLAGTTLTVAGTAKVDAVATTGNSTVAGDSTKANIAKITVNSGTTTVSADANVSKLAVETGAAAQNGSQQSLTDANNIPANILNVSNDTTTVKTTTTVTFSLGKVTTNLETATVLVPITISGAPQGVNGFEIYVNIDSVASYLDFTGVNKGDAISAWTMYSNIMANGALKITGVGNTTANDGAVVAVLTFKAKDNLFVAQTAVCDLLLTSDCQASCVGVDDNGQETGLDIQRVLRNDGSVTINPVDVLLGDINLNKAVTTAEVVTILKYLNTTDYLDAYTLSLSQILSGNVVLINGEQINNKANITVEDATYILTNVHNDTTIDSRKVVTQP